MEPKPVAHHDAVEAPLVAEDVGDQLFGVSRMGSIHAVVCGHDRPDAGLFHDGFKGGQVQFSQRWLTDLAFNRHPLELGVVAHKVFGARSNTLGLHAFHIAHRDLAREMRIFTHAFEVAAADWRAVQVDRGTEQHPSPLRPRFDAEQPPDFFDQRHIESCG